MWESIPMNLKHYENAKEKEGGLGYSTNDLCSRY